LNDFKVTWVELFAAARGLRAQAYSLSKTRDGIQELLFEWPDPAASIVAPDRNAGGPSFFASAGWFTRTAPNRAAVLLWQAMTGAILDFDGFLFISLPSHRELDGLVVGPR
jgi:hypothetical protein